MSQASTSPTAVDRGAEREHQEDEPVVEAGDLRTAPGVAATNAIRCDDSPPPGWEYDPSSSVLSARGTDVDLSEMTEREREVYRSVEVHGIRPADLARMTGADPSTIRTLLEGAREAAR